MKRWVEVTEKTEQERKEKADQQKLKKLEVKEYLLMQMGEEPKDGNGSIHSQQKLKIKQKSVGKTHMNAEELRLNKQILKEISKKKKEKTITLGANSINDVASINESQNNYF